MKKLNLILLLMLSLIVFGCKKDDKPNDETTIEKLKVFVINDLHGALEEENGEYGAARLSWLVEKERQVEGQEVLLLCAGDTFQGSAVSNYSYGLNTLKVMNHMKFDAMTIGNHEFDWDLSTVLNYVDGNESNGEAEFPFLACNIIDKTTNTIPQYVKEYEVVDYGQFQVGIIGYIGSTLESDISASKVANYDFIDPVDRIGELAEELRAEKGCELVLAMGHDASSSTNIRIAGFSGNAAVDGIINAHTHTIYEDTIKNGNGDNIPLTQAGTAGEYMTEIVFNFDADQVSFDEGIAFNHDMSLYPNGVDLTVQQIVNQMTNEIAPIMNEEISTAGRYVSKSSVCNWTADAIYKSVDCDLAAINSGGIRQSAFPINEGLVVTVKKIYEIMPFDNLVKRCQVKGSDLKNILLINDAVFSSNVEIVGSSFYINGELVEDNKMYTFACVDYLFDREISIYGKGENIEILQLLVRDIMIENLKELKHNGQRWLD